MDIPDHWPSKDWQRRTSLRGVGIGLGVLLLIIAVWTSYYSGGAAPPFSASTLRALLRGFT